MVVQDPLLCDLPIQVRAGDGGRRVRGRSPRGRVPRRGPTREALMGDCGPEASRRRPWAPAKVLPGAGAGGRGRARLSPGLQNLRGRPKKHSSGYMTL